MFTPRGWYSRTNRRLSSSPNTAATLNALPILCDSRASTSSFITTTAGGIRRRRTTAEAAGIPFCCRKKRNSHSKKAGQGNSHWAGFFFTCHNRVKSPVPDAARLYRSLQSTGCLPYRSPARRPPLARYRASHHTKLSAINLDKISEEPVKSEKSAFFNASKD